MLLQNHSLRFVWVLIKVGFGNEDVIEVDLYQNTLKIALKNVKLL